MAKIKHSKDNDVHTCFVPGAGPRSKSKVGISVVDGKLEYMFFSPHQPNGEFQELYIGVEIKDVEKAVNMIPSLNNPNREIIIKGITEVDNKTSKVILTPHTDEQLIEMTFSKPGTQEQRPGIPYHDIHIIVRRDELVDALKKLLTYIKKKRR